MQRAAADPALWQQLRDGIPPVLTMVDHVEFLASHYRRLLDGASARETGQAEALTHA